MNRPAHEARDAGTNPMTPEQTSLVERLQSQIDALRNDERADDDSDIDLESRPEWVSHIANIVRAIEDEGDRSYFGSTNDADLLREVSASLDEAELPLRYFKRPDLHRYNKEQRNTITDLQAKLDEAREALRKIDAWCCPVLCANCADNRATARAFLTDNPTTPGETS